MRKVATNITLESELKENARKVLNELGFDFSTVFTGLLQNVVKNKKLPFELKANETKKYLPRDKKTNKDTAKKAVEVKKEVKKPLAKVEETKPTEKIEVKKVAKKPTEKVEVKKTVKKPVKKIETKKTVKKPVNNTPKTQEKTKRLSQFEEILKYL